MIIRSLLKYVKEITENQNVSTTMVIFGVGVVFATVRSTYNWMHLMFERHYVITMEVPSRDQSYLWLLQWITKHSEETQHLSVETKMEDIDTGKVKAMFKFVPAIGVHFFKFRNRWVQVDRTKESGLNNNSGEVSEMVKLTAFGQDRQFFKDILEAARALALEEIEGKTAVYVGSNYDWQQCGQPKKIRPMSSVVLDGEIANTIIADIKEFISSSAWYFKRGVPHRRGYLLYGPPGCGKTSFITALAGELEYSICIVNLSERDLSDERLNYLVSQAPKPSILLLEDVDAAFVSRDDKDETDKSNGLFNNRVTFSGLLNMLDGVASNEGQITFMTTNYVDRLDKALIRPGRVDYKQKIDYATDYQLLKVFNIFYPHTDDELAKKFVDQVRSVSNQVSMAAIQGLFLMHKGQPEKLIGNVKCIADYTI